MLRQNTNRRQRRRANQPVAAAKQQEGARARRRAAIARARGLSVPNNTPSPHSRGGASDERVHTAHLSECASKYVQALADPFEGPLACTPEYPSVPSAKKRVWAKGTCVTSSTTGVGFVIFDPDCMCANDCNALQVSTAAYTGSTFVVNGGAGTLGVPSNAEYSLSDIGTGSANIQYRIVAAGVRTLYAGTELNKGGTIVALMDPNHTNLAGRDLASVDTEKQSRKFKVDSSWVTTLYRPVTSTELSYQGSVHTGVDPGAFYMGMIIQAPAGVSLSFNVEAYAVIEYQGSNVRGQTVTHADPVGAAAASFVTQTSRALLPTTANGVHRTSQAVKDMAAYVIHGISHASHTKHNIKGAHALSNTSSSSSGLWSSLGNLAFSVLPDLLAFI